MADIIPFPRRLKVFDPDLTTTMGNAYDKAMSTLDDRRSELAIRELIAKRIIRMAQSATFMYFGFVGIQEGCKIIMPQCDKCASHE